MAKEEMASSATSVITNMLIWMFLPSAATNFLLKQYYNFRYSKNSPNAPKLTSARHKRNYKLCYTLVVSAYFVYCILQGIGNLEKTYYSQIGVSRRRAYEDIKRRTRQLLMLHHPDKSPSGKMEKYLELKGMSEVIENPTLCNVYEKFGISGVKTVRQTSSKKNFASDEEIRKDYIFSTMPEWLMFYSSTVVTIVLLSATGKPGTGRYWRFVALLILASWETYLYFVDYTTLESIGQSAQFSWTNPLTWIPFLLADVPIFHRVQIARQLFMYIGLAFGQLLPLWFPVKPDLYSDKKALIEELSAVEALTTQAVYKESTFVFNSAFDPFKDNEVMKTQLKRQMGQVALDLKMMESMNVAEFQDSKKNK